jgi:ubiquinone/menaquinone biosynthesis C-methylase UbiE
MDNLEQVREEFARQAEVMSTAPAFSAAYAIERTVQAASATKETRVLDVGCGPGIVVEALAREAREVVAFDLTPEMIAAARKRCEQARLGNVRYTVGRADALPFESGSFDVVVSRLLLHHLADPLPALSEMVRVLRAHGRLVLADVTCSEDAREAELHNALEVLRDPTHVQMRPVSELRRALESLHLTITAEERWDQHREFREWLSITNAPERVAPLRAVMGALAEAGVQAGIGLRREGGSLVFTHRWVLLTSKGS